jgi:hypothetical protein
MTSPVVATAHAASAAKKLVRAEHWATRAYHTFLVERARQPFAWGTNDCATFAADGILALTGVDIAADFRGKYTDEPSALSAIRAIAGGATIADAAAWCAAKFGLPEWKYPLLAQRGDLVVFTAPAEEGQPQLQSGLIHLTGAHVVAPGAKGWHLMLIGKHAQIVRSWHA